MKHIPQILGVMTPFPTSIESGESIAAARDMMMKQEIHHLPVMRDGQLAGMLSERDLRSARSLLPEEAAGLTVGDLCTGSPFVVEHSARLDNVVEQMAQRRIGSAIVTKNGDLVGLITTTDVCRLLAKTLRDLFQPPGGEDAA